VAGREHNFDGLIGPTHSYAGLSFGNVASQSHAGQVGNPGARRCRGLEKMRFVAALGVPQAVLPPHERPHLRTLRRLGFRGSDEEVDRGGGRERGRRSPLARRFERLGDVDGERRHLHSQ